MTYILIATSLVAAECFMFTARTKDLRTWVKLALVGSGGFALVFATCFAFCVHDNELIFTAVVCAIPGAILLIICKILK